MPCVNFKKLAHETEWFSYQETIHASILQENNEFGKVRINTLKWYIFKEW